MTADSKRGPGLHLRRDPPVWPSLPIVGDWTTFAGRNGATPDEPRLNYTATDNWAVSRARKFMTVVSGQCYLRLCMKRGLLNALVSEAYEYFCLDGV